METRPDYRWRRWLPYLSLVSLVAALVLGSVANKLMQDWQEVQRAELRAAREQRLDELQAVVQRGGAASLQSEEVLNLLRELPYTGMSILLDGDGQVVYSTPLEMQGLFGPLGTLREQALADSLRQRLAKAQLSRVLDTLPASALTPEQRMLLETSYALQAQDERADPFYEIGQLLTDAQGNPVGAAAVVYERDDVKTMPTPVAYRASLFGAVAGLIVYWLSLPLWVFLDARTRGERAWLWGALALVGNLLGVITYLLARHPARRQCPACGRPVGRRDNVCPHCARRLRRACPICHEPLEDGWRYCPHCGAEGDAGQPPDGSGGE